VRWLKSQGIDPATATIIPTGQKRPLTESEANEVRSHNLDQTGMTIDNYPAILRAPTPEELKQLDAEGVDIAKLPDKLLFLDPREKAAMEQLRGC